MFLKSKQTQNRYYICPKEFSFEKGPSYKYLGLSVLTFIFQKSRMSSMLDMDIYFKKEFLQFTGR